MKLIVALIPLLPFAGFVITLLLGKWVLGKRADVIPVLMATASWVLSMYVFVRVVADPEYVFDWNAFTWISSGALETTWGFYIDPLAAIMLLVVGTIGMVVHYYSIGYMKGDEGYYRFFAYLNLFMFAMFILVMANNYLLMFLAWEGVGLCSYLLIGFWFRKKSASQAGKKAFLVNRVGDFGFMLGMLLMFLTFGSLQFTEVFADVGAAGPAALLGICLLLFTGAVGKSAQFPLHVWLPDAMEGPTPVSALIHAATMVNAGVYMVARSYPLYIDSHSAMYVVMGVGTFTAIYAALIALTQNDIKRVIAYSTVSSLGFMFMALGSGAWVAGIFYLLTHGFFKGLLFLGSGAVIHAMSGQQDMRFMGGLRRKLPITYWTMLIGALAMVGIFPFAGFWAKDEIIGFEFTHHLYYVWVVGLITAFITGIYMFRLMFMTFHGENRSSPEVQEHIHESRPIMTVPLIILAIPAALAGVLAGWPPESGWIHRFLHPVFFDIESEPFGIVAFILLLVSLVIGAAGITVAWYLYLQRPELPGRLAARFPRAYGASLNKFYMDEIYEAAVIRPVIGFAGWLWTFVDTRVIDGAVNGLAWLWGRFGRLLRPLQTGRAQSYALAILVGVVVLIVIFRIVEG
jgi:NADH-quinone oxidoreductase subunit L